MASKIDQTLVTLSDLHWHCSHELPGNRTAALIRILVDKGYPIEKKYLYCYNCNRDTTHRRMISKTPLKQTISIAALKEKLDRLRIQEIKLSNKIEELEENGLYQE